MSINPVPIKPVFDDLGLEDGGFISDLPCFAPADLPPPASPPPQAVNEVLEAGGNPSEQQKSEESPADPMVEGQGAVSVLNETGSVPPSAQAEAVGGDPAQESAGAGEKPQEPSGKPGEPKSPESQQDDPAKKVGQDLPKDETPESVLLSSLMENEIRAVVSAILAERAADLTPPQAMLTDDELARVAQHLNLSGGARPDPNAASRLQSMGAGAPGVMAAGMAAAQGMGQGAGQGVQVRGGAALAEGVGALVGGALNLVGSAGKAVGQAAQHVGDLMTGKASDKALEQGGDQRAGVAEIGASSGLPAVLPRLSEYRIAQVEKAASNFGREAKEFWNSSTKLTALRSEMERVARERGLSVQDVAERMKPDGDFADLREQFNAAVSENPDSGARKKAMDKALDSYVRQYGRAQEELLNPDQNGNPHYDRYKDRLRKAHGDMEEKSSGIPAFANARGELEPSHFERLKEAVTKIMEKLKEVAQEFMAMFRGKSGGDDHAPAP